ncbi:MAG: alpha/beta fold hydrolase [Planctomycetales bacterium]
MSTLTPEPKPGLKEPLQSSAATVERTPFYLSSQGQPLFAWLHAPLSDKSLTHGVLICPPLGFEQLHAHRSLRHLADHLSETGAAVLRIDWHGTGDSAGSDADPDRLATWEQNVRDGIRWLRQVLGCKRISVIGVRMGASLAAAALQSEAVDDFVLWGPISSGRRYVREMMTIDLTGGDAGKSEAEGDLEAAGFLLTKQTSLDLSQINLAAIHPLSKRILIAQRDDRSPDLKLQEAYQNWGIETEQITLPGMGEMLLEPHRGEVPRRALGEISDWLQSVSPTASAAGRDPTPLWLPQSMMVSSAPEETCVKLRETPVCISEDPNLWGIFSEPEDKPPADRPLILILNAGAAYRIGPGRMNVELARSLAAQGYRSLRLDLGGLGDSLAHAGVTENDSYASTAFRDVQLTLDYLRRETNVQKVVLLGLCSGAYTAFQSAAQLADPLLVESILINPLTYYWKTGMTIDDDPGRLLVKQHYYLSSALQPRKWIRFLSGQTEIGLWGAVKLLLGRWHSRRMKKQSPPHPCPRLRESRIPSHPEREDLAADLDQVVAHGRKLALFFATTDPGYSILMFHVKHKALELQRTGDVNVSFISHADHTFSRRKPRRELFQGIFDHLRKQYS